MKNAIFFFAALALCFATPMMANNDNGSSNKNTTTEDTPYAVFPGGDQAVSEYLSENLQYPMTARENFIEGTVTVAFNVLKDGSISNITIMRGLGYGCDEEVIRVIESMPNWKPAVRNGEAVDASARLKIKFELTK